MNNEIIEKIKDFIENDFGIRRCKMTSESKIDEDLGITGGDAIDLIVSFGKKFKVDVSNFMVADYFNSEGMNWLVPDLNPNEKTLTLDHLVKAVIAGKLDSAKSNTRLRLRDSNVE